MVEFVNLGLASPPILIVSNFILLFLTIVLYPKFIVFGGEGTVTNFDGIVIVDPGVPLATNLRTRWTLPFD